MKYPYTRVGRYTYRDSSWILRYLEGIGLGPYLSRIYGNIWQSKSFKLMYKQHENNIKNWKNEI